MKKINTIIKSIIIIPKKITTSPNFLNIILQIKILILDKII